MTHRMITRRHVLKTGAVTAGSATLGGRAARAAVPEIRFARQFSMGYLQFNAMEHHGLVEKHAKAMGVGEVKVSWMTLNGPDAMNSALISDSIDVVAGGPPGLVTLWARTRNTPQEVRGICALSSQPCLLNTRNPALKSIADLTTQDRVAVPSVKVSIQAVLLEMATAKLLGQAQARKFDSLTVPMAPPDATIALLSGSAGITCVFSVPPFQQQQLGQPGIRTLLDSFDIAGPHSFTVAWTSAKFRNRNPELYKVLMAALSEATDIVNADKAAAGALWLADNKSKLSPDMITKIVAGPQVTWTMTPQGTTNFAKFQHDVGNVDAAPADWKDMFFPEIHGVAGS